MEIEGFTRPKEAVKWLETHQVDLALLDLEERWWDGRGLYDNVRKERLLRNEILYRL